MDNILVIGSGIVGKLTAYYLSQAGASVTILERNDVVKTASWAAGGILFPLNGWIENKQSLDIIFNSIEKYENFCLALKDETNVDPQWERSGLLVLDKDLEKIKEWAKEKNIKFDYIYQSDLEKSFSNINHSRDALFFPDAAQVRPPNLLQALDVYLDSHATRVFTSVIQLNFNGATVESIETDRGIYSSDYFVLCAGAWSSGLLKKGDIDVATVKPIKGEMLLYKGVPGLIQNVICHKENYLIPRNDGYILAGSTLEDVGFENNITQKAKNDLGLFIKSFLNCYHELHFIKQWSGLRPYSEKGVPYIGIHPEYNNLYLNFGHYRHGILSSLLSSSLLSDFIITGQKPLGLKGFEYT
ncbi:MAG: FAD-dependent oxidoreductase [Pseudomonadota bacterium]